MSDHLSIEENFLKNNHQWSEGGRTEKLGKYFQNDIGEKLILSSEYSPPQKLYIEFERLEEAHKNGVKYCAYMSLRPYTCRIMYLDNLMKKMKDKKRSAFMPVFEFPNCTWTCNKDYSCFFEKVKYVDPDLRFDSDPEEYDDFSEMCDLSFDGF